MGKVVTVSSNAGGNTDWEKYTQVDEDFYRAKVIKMEYKPKMKTNFGEKDRWQWHFEIIEEGEFEGVCVTGLTSTSTGSKSGLMKWLKNFYRPLKPNEQVDLDDLIGRICTIYVTHGGQKEDGSHYCNVSNIMRDKEKEQPLLEPLTPEEAQARAEGGDDDSNDEGSEETTAAEAPKAEAEAPAKTTKKVAKKKAQSKEGAEKDLEGVKW